MEIVDRFRGFLPVVVDLETGGFDANLNPILEIACVGLSYSEGQLQPAQAQRWPVAPFPGSSIDPASLKVTGIDLDDPQRGAIREAEALRAFFTLVRAALKESGCHRAVLVAHNAMFDREFLFNAVERSKMKRNPFHPFTTIDTASLAAVAYGHTVLREACGRAGIAFDADRAHNALYDAERTAELFCKIVNESAYVPPSEDPD